MLLFIISVLLIIISTYFLVSILKPKNFITGLIYFLSLAFAQIILITEVLSPLSILYKSTFLGVQIILTVIITYYFKKLNYPFFTESPYSELNKIVKNILKDKSLAVLSTCFVFFLIVSLFLCFTTELTSGDGEIYHIARSMFWVNNHSVNHFETFQVRNLAFPINSEILYAWVILFTKQIFALSIFSFLGFILSITSLYGLMNNFSIRRRVWVLLIVSSFSSILAQASSTETDIIVAGLILSSMYLFREGLKYKNNINIFISSLCYAIALGVKTTAFFAIPAVGIFMIYNSIKFVKKRTYKPFLYFLGFGIINFIIFSAYNYIENLIWFSNPIGAYNTIELHKNYYGLKGGVSNFIKNFTLFFDFTGFSWAKPAGEFIIPIRDGLLSVLGLSYIPDGTNSGDSNVLNNAIIDPLMGTGILGILVFIPALIFSLISILFKQNKTRFEYFIYGIMFILTMFVMSYSIVFMTYNNRFIGTFILLSAPIIGWTYFRKFVFGKWCITFIAIFYLTLVSTHLWSRPAVKIFDALFVKHQTIHQVKDRNSWLLYNKNNDSQIIEKNIAEKIKTYPQETRFLIFPPYYFYSAQLLKLVNEGYHIDMRVMETFNPKDLNKYDIFIYGVNGQSANIGYKFKEKINNYEIINNNINFKNPNSLINCIYFDKGNNVLTSQNKSNPTGVQCTMNNNYLYNLGYKADNIIYRQISKSSDEGFLEYIFLKK